MDGFGHHLGSMLVIYGAVLAHLGAMLVRFGGYDGPSWGSTAPCLVLVGISKKQTALKQWQAQKLWKIP